MRSKLSPVSKAEIIKQLPKLSRRDRREIARPMFEIEDSQSILADSDQRANERFLMLDDLEAKHGKARSR
ncbi:MAG TPA: hypothetical protein VLZ30_08760 [Verrucomicrobiae bacterium]|nr:hypothetical protein [Verrucomicrobiae bacterium]